MAEKELTRTRVTERLETELKDRIRRGELKPGDLILSISELSRRYGVKRPSVQKAIERLQREGYLDSKPKSGVFVSDRFHKQQLRFYYPHWAAVGPVYEARMRESVGEIVRVDSHAAADVVSTGSGTARDWHHAGTTLSFNPWLAKHPLGKPQGWIPGLRDCYQSDGQVFGLPVYGAPLVVFYNRRLFQRAGLPVPHADWTWKDFAETVRALRSVCDLKTAGVVPFQDHFTYFIPFMAQNGGHLVTWDGQCGLAGRQALEALAFVRAVRKDAGGTISEGRELFDRFLGGGSAMLFWSAYMVHRLTLEAPFPWDWVPLPRGRSKATIVFSEALVIPARCEDRQRAWAFVKACISNASQDQMTELALPFPASLAAAKRYIKEHGPGYRAFLDELNYATSDHVHLGAQLLYAVNGAMSGFLDPKLTQKALKAKCEEASHLIEHTLHARKQATEQLIA